jgi:hypothetical protein
MARKTKAMKAEEQAQADAAKIERIVERVDRKEQTFLKRTAYMDSDYDWGWAQTPFKPIATEGITEKDAVTNNNAYVLARKVSNGVASAERLIRVENAADTDEFKDANNATERLAIGMMGNADKRLVSSGMHGDIQGELSWYGVVRGGWIAARAVLIKDDKGKTIEDVVPIDPRNFLFEPGDGEPLWAAIVTDRSRQLIRDKYSDFKFQGEDPESHQHDDADEMERVIDYYWTEDKKRMNAVVIDNQFAKPATDTFAVNFPIPVRLIGNNPGVSSFSVKDGTNGSRDISGIEDVGPSIFTALRNTNHQVNRLASYKMAIAAKRVQGTMIVKSRDGTKEFDQDPFESGSELNLSTDNNEDVGLLPIAELGRELSELQGQLALNESNAGLSDPALGRLNAPLSGRAVSFVLQSDAEVVQPYIEAVESLLEGIIDNLLTQYETGRYKDIEVRGKTHTDQPFNTTISPDDIKGHNILSVELMPVEPDDEFTRWQTAKLASSVDPNSGTQLVSDEYAATRIAKVQDYDYENVRKNAARARQSSEKMVLLTQWEAARLAQDQAAMEMIANDIQRILDKEAMEDAALKMAFEAQMNQALAQTAAGGVGGAPAGGGGGGQQVGDAATISADPRLMPQAGTQGVSVEPSPDAGFNTTAPRNSAEAAGLEPNVG